MAAPKVKSPQHETSGNENGSVQVKKVAPYPIGVRVFKAEGQAPLRGTILKLTDFGFLMKVDESQFYKVGENYTVSFDLPGVDVEIKASVKVIKTYDAMEASLKGSVKVRTIEMHFRELTPTDRSNLHSYLVKSGQK